MNPSYFNRLDSLINRELIKIGSDGKSAEVQIEWKGRNLTLRQKYSSSKSLDEAADSMQKSLEKMLALAEVYQLGSTATKSLRLQGESLIRTGRQGEKKYENIGAHLEKKALKLGSSKEGEEQIRLKRMEVIAMAITLFKVKNESPPDTVIETPSLKNRVSKNKETSSMTKIGRVAQAILFGIAALAFTPLFMLVAGGAALGKNIADYYRISKDHEGEHLLTANKKMKIEEEQIKLDAAKSLLVQLDVEKMTAGLEEKLLDEATHRLQIERLVLRKIADASKKEEVYKIVAALDLTQSYPVNAEKTLSQIVKETVNEVKFMHAEQASAVAAEFRKLLAEFRELESSSKETRYVNEMITKKLRELINSQVYQALKYDPSNPAIQFIHRFAVSIWTEVKVLGTYQEFGQKAIERATSLFPEREGETSISMAINGSIKSVAHDLFQVRHLPQLILYTFTHPLQTLASILSEGHWYSGVIEAIIGKYDVHGRLSNNPSLQGTTTVSLRNQKAIVNNVYGGSPTIKDEISPEFLAVVQAAENNQFADQKDHLDEIPDQVFYTNFQDLKKTGENRRSLAIMHLNQQYPLSFVGITLSKDSDFYLMPNLPSVKWESATKMGEEMLTHLTDDSSFSLEKREKREAGKGDSGFYFPGTKKTWEPIFRSVLDSANDLFKDKKAAEGQEAYQLRGAYQEYVYATLQLYLEVKLTQDLKSSGISQPHLHSQRACKENIDRGGAANAAYLHLRLGLSQDYDQKTKEALVVGTLHCRALGARDRMILPDRLPQVLAFIEQVSPEQFWEQQKVFLEKQFSGKVALEFVPALKAAL